MANPTFIDVQKYLSGVDYPASKDEILDTARSNGAGGEILDALERLPDEQFDDPTDVSAAVADVNGAG